MRKSIGIIPFIFFSFVSPVFADDFGVLSGGSLIDIKSKNVTEIELPVSSVLFKEADQKNSESGFYAENVVRINGRFTYRVVDLPIGKSSQEVFQRFYNKARNSGYEVLFQCRQDACGKKDGYRVYLSKYLNDKDSTQLYLVVKKGDKYKTLYIADLDGQPRVFFLDALEQSQADNPNLVLNLILFPSGQSDLSSSAKDQIDNWVSANMKNGSKIISVFGNADSSGGLNVNIKLAQDRANAVKHYIVKHHHLPESQLISVSAANLARPLSGERGRYVEEG